MSLHIHKTFCPQNRHMAYSPLGVFTSLDEPIDKDSQIFLRVINLEYSKLNITFQYPERIFSKSPKKTHKLGFEVVELCSQNGYVCVSPSLFL